MAGDFHVELDAAISDADRAQKFVRRIRGVQVRNAEHRDFFKSTALSWFRSRRPAVAMSLDASLLGAVDAPYQIILNAAERAASRKTYQRAIDEAKEALVKARAASLSRAPGRTMDTVPDFAPLASDATMQGILARRWAECGVCLSAGAPLAATVMMGGLLEALFVARANKLSDKAHLFKSASAPLDTKTKKPLELRQWTLAPYIDVGHDLKWISRSAKDVAIVLRDYRNYIHPEKERSHGVTLGPDDAAMLWEVTKSLSRELLALKGQT